MKVKVIPLPINYINQRRNSKKCCRLNVSAGSFRRDTKRCQRFARYTIDGLHFCKQHAGEACLEYFITKKE